MEFSTLNGYKVKDKKAVRYYDTVADMKADTTLKSGMYAKTKGYYTINDGGHGEYVIVNDELTEDNGSVHILTNGLRAKLIIENNIINFRQFGGKSVDLNNNTFDNKNIMETLINSCNNLYPKPKIYIPSGVWCFTETHINSEYGFEIYGDGSLFQGMGTIITAYENNQDSVWLIGNSTDFRSEHYNLHDLLFSSSKYTYNTTLKKFDFNTRYTINNSCLRLLQVTFSQFDLSFWYIDGTAISMKSCYENYYNKLFFRNITNPNKGKMVFEENISGSNCTALQFEEIMFETMEGNLIEFDSHTAVSNCIFNNINFEDQSSSNVRIDDASFNSSNYVSKSIFCFKDSLSGSQTIGDSNIINNINLNNFGYFYKPINGTQYAYDNICYVGSNNRLSLLFNNITNIGQLRKISLLKNNHNTPCDFNSKFTFNNFTGYGSGSLDSPIYFDIYRIPKLNLGKLEFAQNIANRTNISYDFKNNQILNPIDYNIINSYTKGNICYDPDCISYNKLGVLMSPRFTYTSTGEFYVFKQGSTMTLSVHAKVASGSTYNLRAVGRNSADTGEATTSVNLVGTGNFEWYTFSSDFSNYNPNYRILFDGVNNNESDVYALIDAIRYF